MPTAFRWAGIQHTRGVGVKGLDRYIWSGGPRPPGDPFSPSSYLCLLGWQAAAAAAYVCVGRGVRRRRRSARGGGKAPLRYIWPHCFSFFALSFSFFFDSPKQLFFNVFLDLTRCFYSLKDLYLIAWRYRRFLQSRIRPQSIYTFHHVPVIERTLSWFTVLV